MAFLPVPKSNDLVKSNFIDLEVNFNTSYEEAQELLALGMTLEDIREYKRTLNGFGTELLQ